MILALTRWSLFLIVGLPFQVLVVYPIYPLVYLFWRFVYFKNYGLDKKAPTHKNSFTYEEIDQATLTDVRDILENDDDHGMLTQYGTGLLALYRFVDGDGNLTRTANGSLANVSGDVVAAWAFAHSLLFESQKEKLKDLTLRVAKNYLKYLGTKSKGPEGEFISVRCNNFGINYCPDSQLLKIGQPMAGPQFWTTSSILACAYNHSRAMKVAFWTHWLLMGGWFWAFMPLIVPNNDLYYVRDISMKALWAHREVFGDRWWIRIPMKKINKTVEYKNALFEAMLGNEIMKLPEVVHAFFSQEKDASSSQALFDSNKRISVWIGPEIQSIYLKAKK